MPSMCNIMLNKGVKIAMLATLLLGLDYGLLGTFPL